MGIGPPRYAADAHGRPTVGLLIRTLQVQVLPGRHSSVLLKPVAIGWQLLSLRALSAGKLVTAEAIRQIAWRRGWDSNPRGPFETYRFSRSAPSATRTPLQQEASIMARTSLSLPRPARAGGESPALRQRGTPSSDFASSFRVGQGRCHALHSSLNCFADCAAADCGGRLSLLAAILIPRPAPAGLLAKVAATVLSIALVLLPARNPLRASSRRRLRRGKRLTHPPLWPKTAPRRRHPVWRTQARTRICCRSLTDRSSPRGISR